MAVQAVCQLHESRAVPDCTYRSMNYLFAERLRAKRSKIAMLLAF